ncbi:hypothetical protein C7974DRAFT_441494 [Boeremia exigua]|uniref:uncharacterized protein n=1 Tax=Boeremia exigua TaxID=749465 RepID=UPI001E8D9B4E|nr:uncharacterized protein C7974DRAFT_441494 [Boeremia exigua]KAH6618916.1 hypothetical protein C7974DRAFT_441494 [Boeremia exigua]
MKLTIALFYSLLVAGVSARGLRVGWEKVFLYLAYRIDQLEPDETKRTMGFKCANFLLTASGAPYCRDNAWVKCEVLEYNPATRARENRNCIGIKEWMAFTDDQRWTRFPVNEGTTNAEKAKAPINLDFDMRAAVKNLNDMRMDQNRYAPARVYKTPANGAPVAFNTMIEDVGQTVKNYITRVGTLVDHPEIQQLRTALDEVQRARVVDHSPRLVEHLQTVLPGGIYHTKKVGTDVQGRDQMVFDPDETVRSTTPMVSNFEEELYKAIGEYYDNSDIARDHISVMHSIETTRNQISSISCGI